MGLKFPGSTPAQSVAQPPAQPASQAPWHDGPVSAPTPAPAPAHQGFMGAAKSQAAMPAAGKPKASWMATGEASATAAQQYEADVARRKEEQGKAFRFWLEEGEQNVMITFVDGNLVQTAAGMVLLPPRYFEHNLKLNGRWGNHFVCPEKTVPGQGYKCPICEAGDRPSLVALFTIIDHRTFTGKENKVYKDTVKLFVANAQAFEQLNMLAQKVGGLAGSRWSVSRAGDKSPRTGNSFFPEGKKPVEELTKEFMYEQVDPKTNHKTWMTKFAPLDYESEIIFRTDEQLRQLGLGAAMGGGPSGFAHQQHQALPQGTNYGSEL